MRTILVLSALWLFVGCQNKNKSRSELPSTAYNYVQLDTATLLRKQAVYAPVYSYIHFESGETNILLAATLSVRNVSYTDTFYLTDVLYYDSHGKLLKNYITAPVQVGPMQSLEFVVERSEREGGAGANFVVRWGAKDSLRNQPLIQTVMVEGGTGIAFVTNGVDINP